MSLRRKLLVFLQSQKKTAEYTELEYLEGDGNQYINLGIIPNNTMGVKAKFYVNSADGKNYVIGSRGAGVGRFYLYSTEKSPTDVKYGWGDIWTNTGLTPVVGTPVEASLNYLNDRKYIYNGTEVNSNLSNQSFSGNTYDMYLFSSNFANVFYNDAILNGRIYYCQITQGDKVIMDLIPVLDKDFVPCMYDKVTSKYFYNQGDGEFKWKLPNQLEYLESNRGQYILTDYYPNPNTAIEVDYLPSETHSVFTCIFGTQDNARVNRFYTVISSTKYRLQVNTYSGNMYYGLNTNGTLVQANNGDFTSNRERVLLKLDCFNKTVSIASDSYTNTYDMSDKSWGDCNCSYPLVIFNRSTAGVITATNGYRGRIYSFKIWENDVLVQYLIPAFDENLNICMYDLVSKTYLYNQGGGSFNYGGAINLFNPNNASYVDGYISTNNGGNITMSTLTDTFYIPCKPNTTYGIMRSSVNVSGQVWRAATVTETPYTGMLCPNFVGGLNNDLTLTITSGANDKYLIFSEGQTIATDDLTKFTVVELGSGSFNYE